MNWKAYLQLMRFHKPIGIFLLWWPTAWSLWLANQGNPPLKLILLFFLGVVCMRAAGCIINDIADRNIDLLVERTKNRPLTSGEVGLVEGLLLLFFLLLLALIILIQLPQSCMYYAVIALLITSLYPFCKRFFSSPQLVLGIAFSMSIPMVAVASQKDMEKEILLLWVINFFWIIAYDTQYAMADREDDLRIGIKSTAVLFGEHARRMITVVQLLFHLCWIPLGLHFNAEGFWLCWLACVCLLLYQYYLLGLQTSRAYLRAFYSNNFYGLLMWIGIVWWFL